MKKAFFLIIGPACLVLLVLLFKVSLEGQTSILRPKPITLVAVGDVMLDRYVRDLMNSQGLDYPFRKLDQNFFKQADILLGNLEGSIVSKKKNFGHMVFGFLPDTAPILKNFGFDVVALANNHALDQGWEGHDSTKRYLTEAGIGWFGHPKGELHEENAHYIRARGKTFAFVGLEDVFKEAGDEQKAIENIKQVIPLIKAQADYVIVSPHWGVEYTPKPTQRQRNFAHAFIDAGADFIIGHHPHVVQEKEEYRGKRIYYSLGNFIFDQYWSKPTQLGLALRITFLGRQISVEEFPIQSVKSQPSFTQT